MIPNRPSQLLSLLLFVCAAAHAGTVRPPLQKNPADARLRDGFSALDRGKLPEADAAFKAELKIKPKRIEAMLGLAEVARLRKQNAETERWIHEAMTAEPKNPLVVRVWARHLASIGRHDQALTAWRQAATLDPKASVALVELGEAELAAGRVPGALSAFQEAATRTPDSYEVQMGLGACLLASKKQSEAIQSFRRAATIAPKSGEPHLSLGLLYAEIRDYPQAIGEFSAALRIDPIMKAALLARGDIYHSQKNYPAALGDYLTVTRIEPRSGPAHLRVGLVFVSQGDLNSAEKAFQKAVQADPNTAQAWNNIAYINAERGVNLDAALEAAKRALALQPRDAGFIDTLAWVHYARREYDRAAATIETIPAASRTPAILDHLAKITAARSSRTVK